MTVANMQKPVALEDTAETTFSHGKEGADRDYRMSTYDKAVTPMAHHLDAI